MLSCPYLGCDLSYDPRHVHQLSRSHWADCKIQFLVISTEDVSTGLFLYFVFYESIFMAVDINGKDLKFFFSSLY